MSTISAATDFAYISNNSYLLIAKGGDLTVQRYDEDGALTTVAGSPVLDGEEKRVLTSTSNGLLKITPSTTNVQATFGPIED